MSYGRHGNLRHVARTLTAFLSPQFTRLLALQLVRCVGRTKNYGICMDERLVAATPSYLLLRRAHTPN